MKITFETKKLKKAISKVTPFKARDDTRPALKMIDFDVVGDKARLTCCDGYILARYTVNCESTGDYNFLVEPRYLKTSLDNRGETIIQIANTNQDDLPLLCVNDMVTANIETSKYPNVDMVFPKCNEFARMSKNELIKKLSPFATNPKLKYGKIIETCQINIINGLIEVVKGDGKRPPHEHFWFNSNLLMWCIKPLGSNLAVSYKSIVNCKFPECRPIVFNDGNMEVLTTQVPNL